MTGTVELTRDRDLPCAGCEYDLRGLPAAGRCPECGRPVADAVAGETLHHADPRWLRRLIIAGWLVPAGLAILVFNELARPWLMSWIGGPPSTAASVAFTAANSSLMAAGMLLLAGGPLLLSLRPQPARFDDRPRRRRLLLVVVVALCLSDVVRHAVFVGLSVSAYRAETGGAAPPDVPGLWAIMNTLAAAFVVCVAVSAPLAAFHAAGVLRRVPRSPLPICFVAAGLVIAAGFVLLSSLVVLGMLGLTGSHFGSPNAPRWWTGLLVAAIVLGYGGVAVSAVLAPLASRRLAAVRRTALRLRGV